MTGSSSSSTISKKIKEKKYYTITIHISIMYSSTSLPRTIFTYTISNLTCHITIYPFHATGLFLILSIYQKTFRFLMFLRGIERDKAYEKG